MISALFVRQDSIYKQLGVDCWDIDRDARLWPGGNAIIAHPPCRAWGQLSHFARPREGEKDYAIQCVKWIRQWGGVLEHPRASRLWSEMSLPMPGLYDEFGGYSLCVDQYWWGHKAKKNTLLYIVGCPKMQVPEMPLNFDAIQYTVASKIKKHTGRRYKKEITRKEREETPILFAKFLIEIAEKANAITPYSMK